MKTKKVLIPSNCISLVGKKIYCKNRPAPGVILFHGLTNTQNDCPLINDTRNALAKSGFHTLTFDFYGSGDSPGKMEDKTMDILLQNSYDAIKHFLKDELIIDLGLWGRSIGGTLVCLIKPHKRIKTRITASGACFLEKTFLERFKQLKKQMNKGGKIAGTGKYKGKYNFKNGWYTSLKGLDQKISQNLRLINSVLVLTTTPDIKVPLNNAANIINFVREPKRIQIYEGVDHDYKGVEKEAIKETVSWCNRFLK